MSDKPDYYEVLGVAKDAPEGVIKSAFTKIAFSCHPDRVKLKANLTQEQKDAAIAKFKLASEAQDVLTNAAKRAAYDKYGHKGVENLVAGKSAASGQTYEEAAGKRMKRNYSEDDTFSFFEKRQEQTKRETAAGDDNLTPEQRRERARQERLARRKGGDGNPPSASATTTTTPSVKEPFDAASSANVFHDVADKMADAAGKLQSGVVIPFDVLEKFRDNLEDFVREVDKAIGRARPGGPKFS
jgi:curved DNA-binding protein CbpA